MQQVWMHKKIKGSVASCLVRNDQKEAFESDGFADSPDKLVEKVKQVRRKKVKSNDNESGDS